MKRDAIIIGFILLLGLSCEGPEKLSEIPELALISLTVTPGIDNPELGNPVLMADIETSIKDGDADIYFQTGDTITPGIYLQYYAKEAGGYAPFAMADTLNYIKIYNNPANPKHQRVFEKQRLNTNLEGILIVQLLFNENLYSKYDTVRIDMYLKDRKGNVSNTITTPDIPFGYTSYEYP